MVRLKKPRLVSLPITEYGSSGNGRGYIDSKIIEVPFTMPGDTVKAVMYRKHSGVFVSKMAELVEASPLRIQAPCSHFAECGGCRLQHLSYEQQLAFKEQSVKNAFKNITDCIVSPIVPCDTIWHYRNKMEFTFSTDQAGNRYLGLIQDSSRGRVCQLEECNLTPNWYVETLKRVYEWWGSSGLTSYQPHRNTGSLRNLTIREGKRTGDRMVILTVSGEEEYLLTETQKQEFVDVIKSMTNGVLCVFLRLQKRERGVATEFIDQKLYGEDAIHERLELDRSLTFRISPSAFFQPNTVQAERLYALAIKLAEIPENSVVYDLYCGTGTISICVATKAKQVIGIEIVSEAIKDARLNAVENDLSNITFLEGDVGKILSQIKQTNNFPLPDVVIVDPARVGLDPLALQNLIELNAPKIVYISCNPSTQAINIKELIQNGYRLTHCQPLDLVPHTVHIENIAILVKGITS